MEQRRPSIWAYILIFVGGVFLLNNFDLLPWDSWQVIWRFWPFILVFIGLQMVLGRSRIGTMISAVISMLLIVFILLVLLAGSNARVNNWLQERFSWWGNVYLVTKQETKEQTTIVAAADYDGVVKRRLEAQFGVANFTLKDDAGDDFLRAFSEYYNNYETPILEQELSGDTLVLRFKTKTKSKFFPGIFKEVNHNLTLGQSQLRTDVDVTVGTGVADVRFDKIGIDDFMLEVGTGKADVVLGKAALPTKSMELAVGTGRITVVLPQDIGLKIIHDVGLGHFSVNGETIKDSGTYTSKNYDEAVIKLEIKTSVGTGEIKVTQQ